MSEAAVVSLYGELLAAWNRRDAAAFAGAFASDACCVGFDGSVMDGRAGIASALGEIFAHHQTASYVAKVREVRLLGAEVAMIRADAGMVPPGGTDIMPAVNAIQTLVAVCNDAEWRVALFQNTPGAFHGRPELAEALSAELREELRLHGVARSST